MARTLDIDQGAERDALRTLLWKAIQSANLNFIIGSGCSTPAIPPLGNIEKQVQAKLAANQLDEADRILFDYLCPFIDSVEQLTGTIDEHHAGVLNDYGSFLGVIAEILFERKNNILPKQATIFTTNYDLFIEKASESFAGRLKLNDGFARNPSLGSRFPFSTGEFFNSVFNNGNLFNYRVELPSVNLVKLHGSLSWASEEDNIVFSVAHLAGLKQEMAKTGRDGDIEAIRQLNGKFSVILPNEEKFRDTLLKHFYYDLLRVYANELDKENTLLIAEGFSFEDKHLLEITSRALRNPTLRLVVFSYRSDEVAHYAAKFASYGNVDIVHSESEEISFGTFVSILRAALFLDKTQSEQPGEGTADG